MKKGLVIIYWGYGKGKTSSAMGVALRALGQGKRVLVVQFMKGGKEAGWETGEGKMFKWVQNHRKADTEHTEEIGEVEFHVAGKGWVKIMDDKKPFEDHERAAQDGLEFVKREFAIFGDRVSVATETRSPNIKWDVIILDEILSAVDSALLSVDDIKALIAAKSPEVHLIMTGHKAYPELVELADLVTKMEKVKHPYDKGIKGQKGVDF